MRHLKIMERLKNFKKRESLQAAQSVTEDHDKGYSRNDALTNAVARGIMIKSLDENNNIGKNKVKADAMRNAFKSTIDRRRVTPVLHETNKPEVRREVQNSKRKVLISNISVNN